MSGETQVQDRPRASALLDQALSAGPHRMDIAALAVACLEYPELPLEESLARLDRLAERVRALLPGDVEAHAPTEQSWALSRVLSHEEGFVGDSHPAMVAEGSFLNRVLDSKVGLPITLSVIYLEVARRTGIPLYGVGMPGHFLVGLGEGPRRIALDPFHGGAMLTEDGCRRLMRDKAPRIPFRRQHLDPIPPPAITYRMLNNLKRAYLAGSDLARALRVVELMLRLAPDHPGELRSRASLLCQLGAYRSALKDVERCLMLQPEAPDSRMLAMTACALRERIELLN